MSHARQSVRGAPSHPGGRVARWRSFPLCLLWISIGVSVAADSMLVPKVELREASRGRYSLEVIATAAFASGLGAAPTLPARCLVGDPDRRNLDESVVVRFNLDCRDAPLRRMDVLVLPWAVDGIEITAHWLDGTSRRALVARERGGVRVRLDSLLGPESTFELAAGLGRKAWAHFWTSGAHVVFALALGLVGRVGWLGLGGLVCGHAAALVLVDAGVTGPPRGPADAVVAGAASLLMAAHLKGVASGRATFAISLIVGLLHALGAAFDLEAARIPSERLVLGVFVASGVTAATACLMLVVIALVRIGGGARGRRVAWALGIGGVFFVLAAMGDALVPPPRTSGVMALPQMDRVEPNRALMASRNLSPPLLDDRGELQSPFVSYLVIEPHQIRHEVLVDVDRARAWTDVEAASGETIPVAEQSGLTETVTDVIVAGAAVEIEGEPVEPASSRADFVVVGADGALTREVPVPEPVESAIIGVSVVYETNGLANAVALTWSLFSDDGGAVPITSTTPAAVAAFELTPEEPRFEWRNTLVDFEVPEVASVRAAHPRIPVVSLVMVAAAACLLYADWRRSAVALFVLAYVSYPFVRVEIAAPLVGGTRIDRGEGSRIVEGLLTNVYRAFDIHSEDGIYDRLERSVTGEELVDIYLESRRTLELERSGGARVRIDDVAVHDVRAVREAGDGAYELDTLWTVGGSVNHFGHVHFRKNQYDATITIVPHDGSWKIRDLELMEERRIL